VGTMPDYPGVTDTCVVGMQETTYDGCVLLSMYRQMCKGGMRTELLEAAIMKVGASKIGERVTASGKLLRRVLRRRRL